MSLTHDMLMMGPVGTPLEDLPGIEVGEDESWFEVDGVQWTVEKNGRHVYTFALDDVWADPTGTPTGWSGT